MKISSLLLLVLAQFSSCASLLCPLRGEVRFAPRHVADSLSGIEDVVPLGDDDFLVASRPADRPTAIEVRRLRANTEELTVSTPPLAPADPTPLLFRGSGRSWFSREGDSGAAGVVVFATEGVPAARPGVVKLTRREPAVWLPIAGDEPRGIEVSIGDEQPALHLDEVTPGGIKELGAFDWWEVGYKQSLLSSRWSAEALGTDRVAIVAVDGPEGQMTLRLRVVGGAEPVETALPCAAAAIDYPLATAVDGSQTLAIVGVSAKREVVALLVDADRPGAARCRVISPPGETAANPVFGTPAVVWTGEDFVASWIRDDGAVRACEFGDLRTTPIPLTIATGADVERPLRQMLHANGEEVTFVWNERHGGVVVRRMPEKVTGFVVAEDFWRFVCALFERANDVAHGKSP